jgi:hypothetical protein
MMKDRKVKAARHRRSRKSYAVPVAKRVHEELAMVAAILGESPSAVVTRLIERAKGAR